MESVDGSENLKMLKMQINEFGQVPKQLFKTPHPQRFASRINDISPPMALEQIETINESEKKREMKEEIEEKQKIDFIPKKAEEVIPNVESSQPTQKEKLTIKVPSHEPSIINESFFLKKKYNLIEKHHKT